MYIRLKASEFFFAFGYFDYGFSPKMIITTARRMGKKGKTNINYQQSKAVREHTSEIISYDNRQVLK
jgi:hypothetical protein